MPLPLKRMIKASYVYIGPDNSYCYGIDWDEQFGYKVKRRKAPKDDKPNYMFWSSGIEVDNYIQLDGGRWDSSWSSRPIMKFSTLSEAEDVIRKDIEERRTLT